MHNRCPSQFSAETSDVSTLSYRAQRFAPQSAHSAILKAASETYTELNRHGASSRFYRLKDRLRSLSVAPSRAND